MVESQSTWLIAAGVQVLLLWFALAAREAARAAAAAHFGDPGLREDGRTSLNPMAHFDLAGTLVVPVLMGLVGGPVVGWGARAPIDFRRLDDDKRGSVWIFLAGPLVNLAIALIALAAFAVAVVAMGEEAADAAMLGMMGQVEQAIGVEGFPLLFTLERAVHLNAYLCVFHLLPFPPLDGGFLAMQYVARRWALRLASIELYGCWLALLVAIVGRVDLLLLPIKVVEALIVSA